MTARNTPDDIKTKQKSYAIKKANRVIVSLYLKGAFSRCTTGLRGCVKVEVDVLASCP